MDARTTCRSPLWVLWAWLPLLNSPAGAEEPETRGSVEIVYRSVSVDGSRNKYNEDFDALESGLRLGAWTFDWQPAEKGALDYARLDARGLGGDPYERASARLGRKDRYELRLDYSKQDYFYDLFELVNNEDGARWDAVRRTAELGLDVHVSDRVRLTFGFQENARSGTSLFMKDIERDLFRLETPLDALVHRYTVGADFRVGTVDVLFRQQLRRYDNQFDNMTEGDLGLDTGNATALDTYHWSQNDSGATDLTTLRVHTPIGERLELTVSLAGSLVGREELESHIRLTQLGTSFSGSEFGGTCAASGTPCASDATCAAIMAGDVCVPHEGRGAVNLDGDTLLVSSDLQVDVASNVAVVLQYRSLDRDLGGTLARDLDGDGAEDDLDGDGNPATTIRNDYRIRTATAAVDVRPAKAVRFRVGYRRIERELDRDGFGDAQRDLDYDSGDDAALVASLHLKPKSWLRFDADYEDGDVDQPFHAVAPQESRHLRLRLKLRPKDGTEIGVSFLDFERDNAALDIRDPASLWSGAADGTTRSLEWRQRFGEPASLTLRYSRQDFLSDVGITFDRAGFGAVEDGRSVFDNENTQFFGQLDFRWGGPWEAYARYWGVESEGNNLVLGSVSGLVNDETIAQDFTHAEAGLVYRFGSGVYVGGSLADFDYDDANDRLDYDGRILTLRFGTTF